MDAVTYPRHEVTSFISSRMIPLRLRYDAEPHATNYKVKWTPSILVIDREGDEHHRTVGFMAPEEFIPSLLLGSAKLHFDAGRFHEALENLGELLDKFPKSHAAPEAIYYRGVAGYKATHEAKPLKAAYEKLAKEYPESEWAKRAHPYSLL